MFFPGLSGQYGPGSIEYGKFSRFEGNGRFAVEGRRVGGGRKVIELRITDENAVELAHYSAGATLGELIVRINDLYLRERVGDRLCTGCGRCCGDPIALGGHDLKRFSDAGILTHPIPAQENAPAAASEILCMPSAPDLVERKRGIFEMRRQYGFDESIATLLYEYNTADPVRLSKRDDGMCVFLSIDGLCSIYEYRPLVCRLYVCKTGERLSALHESIVAQIAWHGYEYLGWVDRGELSHNPFFRYADDRSARIGEFDADLSDALEQLFCSF